MFEPLNALLSPHIGLFWKSIQKGFPICQEANPVARVVERYGTAEPQSSTFQISDTFPLPRIWLISEAQDELIQIQRDWFIYNWKKPQPSAEYPRFKEVYKRFKHYLHKFSEFLRENGLGRMSIDQYELTYVNHILIGEELRSLGHIGEMFPDYPWREKPNRDEQFLPAPDGVNLNTRFLLPDTSGRLYISIRSAHRSEDQKPVIRLDMKARGISSKVTESAMDSLFKTAHEWIVRGFADITSVQVQQNQWGRKG